MKLVRQMYQRAQAGLIHIPVIVLLLLGLVAGVYLVQHPQILKSKATGDLIWLVDENGDKLSPKDGDIYEADKPQIRKEHFKPFNSGNVEWQYVEFQYIDEQEGRIGVTVSISELTNPNTGVKAQQLLIMKHNINTGETRRNVYNGLRTFDEATSTYTFAGEIGGEQLAKFAYDETNDRYKLEVHTNEFDSNRIDSEGLVLNPQGNLIPVSKDGHFTVAAFEGGKVITNYFADHIRVEKGNGEIVGYGRRDSENLQLEGSLPAQPDIDHTWVHVSGDLENGRQVYITAWHSKTGGDFKFADILVVNPVTGVVENTIQANEEDNGFSLSFESSLGEQETPPGQTQESKYQMAHGGKVVAKLDDNTLFELEIDGNPGQIIDDKGILSMVEAHGRLVSGSVGGLSIKNGNSAIWETTDEIYSSFLPLIIDSKRGGILRNF